jgi:membrane protein DedA with SNARE-associated domain
VSEALDLLAGLPGWLVYLLLAAGAATENLLPPVPADTFVVVGGLLASRGTVDLRLAWLLTWAANVAGALAVYGVGRRHGRTFFEEGVGRRVLNERQLQRLSDFYARRGTLAVFLARFLPGLRAVVPAFAGIGRLAFPRTAAAVAGASGIWYGALVWMGSVAGRNLERVERWLSNTNSVLLVVALILTALIGFWWWRTRHPREGEEPSDPPEETGKED